MQDQIIAHIDMDSFYASVEIRDDPSLLGRPVVIGSDPQEGRGRGVISTCSYEARSFGLHSGMPISRAWHLCPHAVYIRPSGKYETVSADIMNLLHEFTEEVEQVSIDEAYLNFSSCISWDAARNLALRIKDAIREREQLTCSIGIAPARIYAKIASDLQKPDGLVIIPPKDLKRIIDLLPVSKIPGIGRRSTCALESLNIRTIHDLACSDIQNLQDIFGVYAVRVHDVASGLDTQGLKDQGPQQSIGRETTFAEDTDDEILISDTLCALATLLHFELERKKARCRTVGIRIRYTGFITHTRAISGAHADDNETMIIKTAVSLFNELWNGESVRLVGIRLSGLVYQDPVQTKLQQFISI
ncbi:MAG: DNA polymerase IV [Methanomicrobiales archaeon HGW-Methanomicrobiales-4]|nr:MAG: DNA polymerase IV [Methanomicrobiales archaeon HGW-Methanomicrobiales-4]